MLIRGPDAIIKAQVKAAFCFHPHIPNIPSLARFPFNCVKELELSFAVRTGRHRPVFWLHGCAGKPDESSHFVEEAAALA